jgi:hypothetical protein
MNKAIILSLLISIAGISANGQGGRDIVQKSRDAVKVSSFEATSTLIINDGRGNQRIRKNTMASKTFADNTEKRIIKFISPAEVKGTGILIFDHDENSDDMWIYLPAMRKTRRIVSSEKSKGFMGSEFSNADMTAPAIDDFTYAVLGSESMNDKECWKLESIPINMDKEDEYGYSRVISWICKNDYIVQRTEFYDFDDEHFKTIETLKYKLLDEVEKKYMITEMFADNLSSGRSSSMKMDQIQISDTNEDYFTVAYLER